MARDPVAGRSKTRLAREAGVGRATAFARVCAAAVMRRLACDPRWKTHIAVTPDTAVRRPTWPCSCEIIAQGHGDLGRRMQRLFARLLPGPVLIVGTDIPRIRTQHIARAFALLGSCDAVLGPAGDGGYWLVGLRRRPRILAPFGKVRWSGPHAFADTLSNLSDKTVGIAATIGDVDDLRALRREARFAGRVVLPP